MTDVHESESTVGDSDHPTPFDDATLGPTVDDRATLGGGPTVADVTLTDAPTAPVDQETEAPTVPDSPAATTPESRSWRQMLMAGLAGGLVGALVASGVYLVFDNDARPSAPAQSVIVRGSNKIATTGDIAAILRADVPAVVAIVDDGGPQNGGAAGTGFVISADGVIVTNNHVVAGASRIQAQFSDGTSRVAKVLGRDASSDLAVIKVDAANLPTIELGDSDQVQVGDDVVAIGNALALQGGLSVTRGIISGLHRQVDTNSGGQLVDVLQTDAAINPGNSGGPLVDFQGRVIGINTAIADPGEAQNVGFAIPISQAKPIIDQLAQGMQPAYLGVYTADTGTSAAQQLGVSATSGAVVTRVPNATPADKAGIQVGDVIVELGGQKVTTSADLGNVVRRHKPGEDVRVVVVRDGQRKNVTATLVERPTN